MKYLAEISPKKSVMTFTWKYSEANCWRVLPENNTGNYFNSNTQSPSLKLFYFLFLQLVKKKSLSSKGYFHHGISHTINIHYILQIIKWLSEALLKDFYGKINWYPTKGTQLISLFPLKSYFHGSIVTKSSFSQQFSCWSNDEKKKLKALSFQVEERN